MIPIIVMIAVGIAASYMLKRYMANLAREEERARGGNSHLELDLDELQEEEKRERADMVNGSQDLFENLFPVGTRPGSKRIIKLVIGSVVAVLLFTLTGSVVGVAVGNPGLGVAIIGGGYILTGVVVVLFILKSSTKKTEKDAVDAAFAELVANFDLPAEH